MITRRFTSRRPGSGRKNNPFARLTTARLAPMPSASVSTATAVKPGFFSNWRKANLRSFITQSLHRIDSACSPGRPPASEDRDNQERSGSQKEHRRIPRRNAEQKTLHQPCPAQGEQESGNRSGQRKLHPLIEHPAEHSRGVGA